MTKFFLSDSKRSWIFFFSFCSSFFASASFLNHLSLTATFCSKVCISAVSLSLMFLNHSLMLVFFFSSSTAIYFLSSWRASLPEFRIEMSRITSSSSTSSFYGYSDVSCISSSWSEASSSTFTASSYLSVSSFSFIDASSIAFFVSISYLVSISVCSCSSDADIWE